jgi:DNA-binding MarR family transcriptional regulator
MQNRKQKTEELMESFQLLRRSMALRPIRPGQAPRITPSQWGALMLIGQREETTVKDLAKSLRISSSATTQLIDGLVESGYVMRQVDDKDRRSVTLTLSRKTKSKMDKLKKERVGQLLTFFKALSDKEFDQYIALNKKILDNVPKK